MLATPVLFRLGQSLPAASTPAPGPHTSRIGMLSQTFDERWPIQVTLGAFSDTGWGDSSGASTVLNVPIEPYGTWTYV